MNHPIPDIDRCLQLMDTFAMWENIRRHSFLVARVAELLQMGLAEAGRAPAVPDRELVVAGALLHDIAKSKCIEEKCRHAEVGATLCSELGYGQVAEIVENHVVLSEFRQERYVVGDFTASELVFYADKRVRHDEVVTLDERLEYILGKYGDNNQRFETLIHKNFQLCRTLENTLFTFLDFSAAEVPAILARESLGRLHYPTSRENPHPDGAAPQDCRVAQQ